MILYRLISLSFNLELLSSNKGFVVKRNTLKPGTEVQMQVLATNTTQLDFTSYKHCSRSQEKLVFGFYVSGNCCCRAYVRGVENATDVNGLGGSD